jgi:hypothetical protein
MVALLSLMLLFGCGGGGHSESGSAPPNRLRQAVETAVKALDEEAGQGIAAGRLYRVNELAGNLVPLARGDVANTSGDTACVTVEMAGASLIIVFDGSEACKGVSGSLRITPVNATDDDPAVRVSDIDLIEFDTGDGCPINGIQRSTVTIEGDRITAVCTYTDLDLCGETLTGEVILRGRGAGDWQIEMQAHTYRYENGAQAAVTLACRPETGSLSGEARVQLDGRAYAITAEEIVVDPACGLPTGGSLTIRDPEGDTALADFSETRCDAPWVRVIQSSGTEETWPLFDGS